MKSLMAVVTLAAALMAAGTPSVHSWKKHISSTAFSFHYPAGWQVKEQESVVAITNPGTQEELLILALPFEKGRTPLALANQMLGTLRTSLPDLKGSGFRSSSANAIAFQCTYSEKSTPFRSEVLVVKDASSAHWFNCCRAWSAALPQAAPPDPPAQPAPPRLPPCRLSKRTHGRSCSSWSSLWEPH